MSRDLCHVCDGDGELAVSGFTVLEHALRNATRVRALYLACRRTLALVHRYRAEDCARREPWRADARILACLERVQAFRLTIRSLRFVRAERGHYAWCVACRGSGLADNACEGCGRPVDLETMNQDAIDYVDVLVHRGCDTGHSFFHPSSPKDLPLWRSS